LRCAQGKPMFDESSEVVMPRAKPQMAGQMVSQVVMKAPTKEAVAAGQRQLGSGRSDGVVVERGSRRIPRRRKWSSG